MKATRSASVFQQLVTGIVIGLTAMPPSVLSGQVTVKSPTSSWTSTPRTVSKAVSRPSAATDNPPMRQRVASERTARYALSDSPAANSRPSLSAISNQVVNVGQRLSVPVAAFDPDVPSQTLLFSLIESPTNARIHAVNGTNAIIGWTPQRSDAKSTNTFTAIVRDDGEPSLSATQSFAIIVTELAQATLGTVVLQAGQNACLPITFDSTEAITNINFAVHWPPGTLSNFTVHPVLPEICSASVESLSLTQALVSLSTCPGQSLTLTESAELADLCFAAISGQASSFVPLLITNGVVKTVNGTIVTNQSAAAGRVVVVGDRAILEALFTEEQERQLFLYARPGFTYQIESTTNLSDPPVWIRTCQVPMTGPALLVCCVDLDGPTVFYRAYESGTGPTNQPPLVDAGPDQVIRTNTALLRGTASDDGLPAGCKPLTYAWSSVSGPGGVTFGSPTSAVTTASFTVPGSYTLRLSVSDSQDTGRDDVNVAWDCFFSRPEDWLVTVSPPNSPGAAQSGSVHFTNCEAILSEGGSFLVAMERVFEIPAGAGLLCITYEGPIFDTSDLQSMHDAFEVALVDNVGRPLTFTIQSTAAITPASATAPAILPASPDALFNHTEGNSAFVAPGVAVQSSTLNIDISHLAAGLSVRLVIRLINNDNNSGSTVRLRDVRFKPADPSLELTGSPPYAFSLLRGEIVQGISQAADPCSATALSFAAGGNYGGQGLSQSATGPAYSNAPALPPTLFVTLPTVGAGCTTPGRVPLGGHALAGTLNPAGHSVPNRIILVSVNGLPVQALDVAGNFFHAVDVLPGQNVFSIVGADAFNQAVTNTVSVEGCNCPSNFATLGVVSASTQPEYARTSFNDWSKTLYADVSLRNMGSYPVQAPMYLGITRISDPTVTLLAADGVSADGIPFYDFTTALNTGSMNTGAVSAPRTLAFHNPNQVPFTYELAVLAQLNQAPRFITVPPIEVIAGHPYTYDSDATDPDGDALTYSLLESPLDMSIQSQSGLISWTATNGLGTYAVRLRADDGRGGTAEQQYLLNLIAAPSNRPPSFISTPVTIARVGSAYVYDADALDADGDALTYALTVFPSNMTINPVTGRLEWTPETSEIGDHSATILVSDGRGGSDEQSYALCVLPAEGNRPPIIVSQPITEYILVPVSPSNAITLDVRIRDFNDEHPDFEGCINFFVVPGIVQSVLGPDGTPLFAGTSPRGCVTGPSTFSHWFHDVPGTNLTAVLPLTLTESSPGSRIYAFTNNNFFPIDGQLFGNEGRSNNFHFTVELHSTFIYRTGQVFSFSGDDDTWVFINKQLVVDLGGVYQDASRSLNLDGLGLAAGRRYALDLFTAERSTGGSLQRMSAGLELFGGQYATRIAAIDPENDSLTYELITAPPGMLIDPTTGLITWNPGNADLGAHSIRVKVADSRGATAEQDFTVTVIAPESGVITGTAFNDSNTNGLHDVSASEPGLGAWIAFIDQNQNHRQDEGEVSTLTGTSGQYSFSNLAAGTYSVRLVSPGGWVPTTPSNSMHAITLTNGHVTLTADFGMQQRTNALNSNPRFVSQPPANPVAPRSILLYQASASDADGAILVFDLVVKPDGMVVESNSGLVAWEPTLKQLGMHDVILRVQDGRSGVALQAFQLNVVTNPPPVITTVPPGQAVVGLPLQYIIRAQDPDGQVLSFSLASVTALTLRHFDIAIGGTVTNGVPGPGAGNIEIPNEHDIYTFMAAAGQKVFFDVLAVAGAAGNVYWKLNHESGAVVFSPRGFGSGDPASITLTNGGMYTIDVGRDDRSDTGTYSFRLTDVPTPDRFVIGVGDTVTNGVPGPGAGNIETPGVQDVYTFTAAAGQKVFFDSLVSANINWKANHESGTVVFQRRPFGSGDPGVITLTSGGTYIIEVGRDDQSDTGTYSFKLWNVPPPEHFDIAIGLTVTNGVPAAGAGNIETPGVKDTYTFTAAAGQQLFFDVLAGFQNTLLRMVDETNGIIISTRSFCCGDPGILTLNRGGDYTITIGSDTDERTGTYSFRITNVAESAQFDLSAAGPVGEEPSLVLPDAQAPPQQVSSYDANSGIFSALDNNAADTDPVTGITLAPFASNSQTPGSGGAALSWTPALTNIGTYRIEIMVRDSGGAETRQVFDLEVVAAAPNHSPIIISAARPSIRLGMTYGYQISGIDSDADLLQYHLGPCCLQAPSNQITWWRAEGDALDSEGTNHGLLSNGVTFATGQIGQAFSFDGVDDKVSIPESSTTDISQMTNWTIEAWVKPLRFTGSPTIYSEGRWGASLGLQTGTGKPESRINNANQFVATTALQSNQWNHVALVYNGASRTFYVNGVFAGIVATPAITTPDTNGAAIGDVTHNPSSSRFTGQIDELTLYRRPLEALEIQAIYSAAATGKCTNSQQSLGPAGLVLDPNGLLLWTPTPDQLGTHTVQICADDGRGGFASQSFTIVVSSTLSNQPPLVVSIPPGRATADQLYQYNMAASDPDNDSVTWQLVSGPFGMSIDPVTGSLRWTPTHEQLGTNSVTVEVQDVLLATATQSWTIDVGCLNGPPLITSVPATEAHVGEPYLYALSASDPDGDPLTFSFADTNAIPAGMTLSNLTSTLNSDVGGAVISWTPTTNQVGSYLIRLAVSDGRGGTDTQNYTLYVSDLHANKAPIIVTSPPLGAGVGQSYSYLLRATDPDGDTLTLQSLLPLPEGATFTPSDEGRAAGVLSWSPTAAQLGSHEFILTAQDPSAASASQRFVVTVRSNAAPQILSSPGTNGIPNLTYRYDVVVSDPDGDPLTFTLNGPSGMTIESLGRIAWTPAQTGAEQVTVTVSDGYGGTAVQTFTLIVGADTEPPSISLSISYNLQDSQGNLYVLAGTEVPVGVNASDNVGIATLELRIDGVPVPVNAGGSTMVPFPLAGSIEAIAQARDLGGNLASVTNRIPVIDPYETNTVTIAIHSPTNSAEVTSPVDVVATITSQEPLSEYRVEYAAWSLSDSTIEVAVSDPRLDYQTITNVVLPLDTPGLTNAVLARFDPTLLLNGGYIIRVTAYDQNRQGRQEGVFVNVTGNLKFGEFRFELTDLTIPVAGIPITIKRIYDTRDSARQGDFGYGWTLGIQDAHILEVGKSTFTGLGGPGTTFSSNTRVYLTTPDGLRVGFSFKPEFSGGAFLFGAFYKPAFDADPGVYDVLEPLEAPAAYQFNSRGQFTGLFGLSGYTPNGYKLTTKNNLIYVYDLTSGLKSVTDQNGNNLQYTYEGIFHRSAGTTNVDQSIRFIRDSFGRIRQIIDPDNHPLTYIYDTSGDLRSFTDQVTNETQYIYHAQRAHYLTNIIDSLGNQALRLEYDDSGRLVSVTDAMANPIRQDFNSDNLTGTVTDAKGNVTILHYDEGGNETMRVLEGVYTNRMEYDANNNVIRGVNGRGHTTNFTYDANGNTTSITDALSNCTSIAYNTQNKPVAITNALGQTMNFRYDTAGNVLEVVNNAGFRTSLTRDSQGRVTSVTDVTGANTTTLDYTGGCSCGKPGKVINPDGSFRLYEYNSLGQTNRMVNELGAETLLHYDDRGQLLWIRDPLSNYTQFFYNGPLLTNVVDTLGRTTRYEYDARNRTNAIINAEGGIVRFEYDANGNLTTVTDAVASVTRFVYDQANRLTRRIDPLGHTNFFAYDAAGNLVETIDRDGRRRTFACDPMNRMTNELWWEGTNVVRSIVYQFNALGIQAYASDPAATYRYTYDTLNRLERVEQTANPGQPDFTLSYTYTPGGQVATVTDNWGVSVGSSYNNRNWLASRTWQGPGIDPARVDFVYDAAGERTRAGRYTDLAGLNRVGFTTNTFDLMGLVANITHFGPTNNVLARYEYVRDASRRITRWTINDEVSRFDYDRTDQLTKALHSTLPDEDYAYDANGTRTGLQSSGSFIVGINNQILSDGTNTYGYDFEGNITSKSNNISSTVVHYSYDHRNRLVSVIDLSNGGVTNQTVFFAYDVINQRLSKTVDGRPTRFLYNQADSWADLDESNVVVARYLIGAKVDEMLARWRSSDDLAWYLTDNLGTVREIADFQGTKVAHIDYSSFGQILSISNPSAADRFLFAGREFDGESGLYFNRARYYNARLGRFINQDPLGFGPADFNLYRYVGNNPIARIDPTGMISYETYVLLENVFGYIATLTCIGAIVSGIYAAVGAAYFLINNDYFLGENDWQYAVLITGILFVGCAVSLKLFVWASEGAQATWTPPPPMFPWMWQPGKPWPPGALPPTVTRPPSGGNGTVDF